MKLSCKTYLINLIFFSSYVRNSSAYMVNNNPYHRKEILDSEGNYQFEWLVNLSTKRIKFTVTAKTNGAIGFGLTPNGKMTGADVVIGGVFPNGSSYFMDYHAVGNQIPETDPSQDWILDSATENQSFTVLKFSRLFDTCDPQDYPITENKISLIWSYTEQDTPSYHRSNRGEYQVYLLHPDYTPAIVEHPNVGARKALQVEKDHNLKTWTLQSSLVMPAQDTTYWCTMHKSPPLPTKHHLIGYEILFPNPQSRQHVHHLVVFKCHAPTGGPSTSQLFSPFVQQKGQLCYTVNQPIGPMPTQYCTEYYQVFGVGGRPYFYPPHVGVPFGETKDDYYILQVHYDNPNRLSNVQVEVSIKTYCTSYLRENEAGIFTIRHMIPGVTPSLLIPPSTLNHRVRAFCGGECTQRALAREGIWISGVKIHMHNTGAGGLVQHFRGNRELAWIRMDNNYGFDFQQILTLHKEVRVLPGDMLTLKCDYDNTKVNGTTVGGYSSQQEMCSAFFMYCNRNVNYVQCRSEIEKQEARERFLGIGNVTWSSQDLEYIVDPPDELADLRVTQVSDNYVKWDEKRRGEFQEFILREPHVNKCSKELYTLPALVDYRKFSSWEMENELEASFGQVRFPYEIRPYRPSKSCSFK